MEKFDAVVVGAGPAGCAAALELARHGAQVLILERGKVAGAKNATGGLLYGQTNTPFNLDYLLPRFHEEAPVERSIHEYWMHAVSGNKVKSLDISRLHAFKTRWSYSVLRGKFDPWLAAQAQKAAKRHGGGLLTDVTVTGPLIENGEITGVESEELDPIRADVIVAADGATSNLARKSGLRTWGEPEQWFQGVKVVAKVSPKTIEEKFGAHGTSGTAHLYAGDLFRNCRGGGFLYTNKETLSIGTVFHLDSLAAKKQEPHRFLDALLTHPLLANAIGEDYEELEYSAKLIPDGKKMGMAFPAKGRLLVVGDAAGHMKAAGPIIKGMNLGITGGILAAQAYLLAKNQGRLSTMSGLYASFLRGSYLRKELWAPAGRILRKMGASGFATKTMGAFVKPGAWMVRSKFGQKRIQKALSSYRLASVAPDTAFVYAELPTVLGAELGTPIPPPKKLPAVRDLDDRIGSLSFDTDVGREHIKVLDAAPSASGRATHTCPVSSPQSSRGCYRLETFTLPGGRQEQRVVLDTQPCVECGTCALMAKTDWEHPRGSKGVEFRWG